MHRCRGAMTAGRLQVCDDAVMQCMPSSSIDKQQGHPWTSSRTAGHDEVHPALYYTSHQFPSSACRSPECCLQRSCSSSSSGGTGSSFSDPGSSSCRSSISDGSSLIATEHWDEVCGGGSSSSRSPLRRRRSPSPPVSARRLPGQRTAVTQHLGLEVAPQLLMTGTSGVAVHCTAAGCAAVATGSSMSSGGGSALCVIKEEVLEMIREDAPLHVTLE